MNTKDFYGALRVDHEIVMRRMLQEDRIKKYLRLFVADSGIEPLEQALAQGDCDLAFRQAHAIKGVTLNLELTPLSTIICEMVEKLRDGNLAGARTLFLKAKAQYEQIEGLVRQLD